jgi:hypothetical protein
MRQSKIAIIISNRDFFPDVLVQEARRDLLQVFEESGVSTIILNEQETKLGALETCRMRFGARICSVLIETRLMEFSFRSRTLGTRKRSPTRSGCLTCGSRF